MKTTLFLYGVEPERWANMSYLAALIDRVACAIKLKKQLCKDASDALGVEEVYTPILVRYQAVEKAIDFNRNLIAEIEE